MPRRSAAAKREEREFNELLEFIRQHRGFDASSYKPASLKRRITKRMNEAGFGTFGAYRDFLQAEPGEFVPLIDTLLIKVTSFFRDAPAWRYVATKVIPEILNHSKAEPIRVWSVGCATGEEAYTAAMVFAEAMSVAEFSRRVKVFATDVDETALAEAREAAYTEAHLQGVPTRMRKKYMQSANGALTVKPVIRRAVTFGQHNILSDPPISHVDLLICRNLLMYFNKEGQRAALVRLLSALEAGGFLFVGKAEMLTDRDLPLRPMSTQHRVFRKESAPALAGIATEPATVPPLQPATTPVFRDVAFAGSAIAQIVLDNDDNLVMANDMARSLLGVGASSMNTPLKDLELSFEPAELRRPIREAKESRRTVILADIVQETAAGQRFMDIHVAPLINAADELRGTSINFYETTGRVELFQQLKDAKEALESAYEELQAGNEELETTNEELQSANEELETTNEELQSANEELETMNQELQSTNEELDTANAALLERGREVIQANDLLESILGSLDQSVVVVDKSRRILSWNAQASEMWGLRSDEVTGQAAFSLDIGFPLQKLRRPMGSILSGRAEALTVETDAINRRGRTFACKVTIRPLRGREAKPDGAVIFMEDVG